MNTYFIDEMSKTSGWLKTILLGAAKGGGKSKTVNKVVGKVKSLSSSQKKKAMRDYASAKGQGNLKSVGDIERKYKKSGFDVKSGNDINVGDIGESAVNIVKKEAPNYKAQLATAGVAMTGLVGFGGYHSIKKIGPSENIMRTRRLNDTYDNTRKDRDIARRMLIEEPRASRLNRKPPPEPKVTAQAPIKQTSVTKAPSKVTTPNANVDSSKKTVATVTGSFGSPTNRPYKSGDIPSKPRITV